MGPATLNPRSVYARLAWPTHLIGQARKLVYNSSGLLFVYDNLRIKRPYEVLGCEYKHLDHIMSISYITSESKLSHNSLWSYKPFASATLGHVPFLCGIR